MEPGDYVVHYQHGVGRYLEMKPLTMAGIERDYLWLEFKDGKVYVPTDQVGLVRKYTGGETPSLNRMGGADFERQRAKVRSAVREIAEDLVVLYRQRLASPGRAFGPDTPWQHEIEEAFPFEETPDQLQAILEVKADMERPDPDGPSGVRRRRLRQDRGRGAGRVQGGAGRHAGRDPRAHHPARRTARPDVPRALRQLPGAGRGAVALPVREGTDRGRARLRSGRGRHPHRHPPAALGRREGQEPRAARGRRGAALRRAAQGAHQAARDQRRRADAHGHADPPHARAVAHRHPRPLAGEHPAGRSPADPHLRRRVRRPCRRPRRSGASCCARARCSTCTTACATSSWSPRTCARSCPKRGSRSRTGRWTRTGSSGSCSTSGSTSSTCSCARRSSRAASTCRR